MDKMQRLAAETALRQMAQKGWMDICTVDKIVKMTGVVPDRRAYEILHLMHCTSFKDLPSELREQVPALLREVLGGTELDLAAALRPEPSGLQVIDGGTQPTGWLRKMIGHES